MNRYPNSAGSLTGPAEGSFDIDPEDSETLPRVTRAIYVGSGGSATVRFLNDEGDRRLVGLQTGCTYAFRLTAVRRTGLTAGSLVGLD